MSIALIFAGGIGKRMKSVTTPKQFLKVNGKPIIIYTIEKFQENNNIDQILVICVKTHMDFLKKQIEFYKLDKVIDIIAGGTSGQESIFKGLDYLYQKYDENEIVLIHDGVRPLINNDLIDRNIESVKKNGNAISCTKAKETICTVRNNNSIETIIDRDKCALARAPQSFKLGEIYKLQLDARNRNLSFIDCASLLLYHKLPLYYVTTDESNIKITTPIDFYLFKSIVEFNDNLDVLGVKDV